MKLVIDIPDAIKEMADEGDNKLIHLMWMLILIDAIKNGIILPKGHGRLIDESKIDWLIAQDERWTTENRIKNTSKTVIEADKN